MAREHGPDVVPERCSVSLHAQRSTFNLGQGDYLSSPYTCAVCTPELISILHVQFSLSPDPNAWGAYLTPDVPESDDYLHNPDPKRDRRNDQGGNIFTYRGITNLGCLLILAVGIITLL